MYHVAGRYASEVNQHKESETGQLVTGLRYKKISNTDMQDLLHAALLHDVGHLPFSHVTEKIFESAVEEFTVGKIPLKTFLIPIVRIKKVSLSEALSLAIVLSPRFQKFYTTVVRHDSQAPYRIALLIAGLRIKDENSALPELISSTLDADKIDYQLRDSTACNIPIGVDVSRLFHRSAFISAAPNAVPKDIDIQRPIKKNFIMFAVNSSGIDTVEEIALARTMLYQRVYSHRVTRNAERILGKIFFDFLDNSSSTFADILNVWKLGDEELLRSLEEASPSDGTKELTQNLRFRNLPQRACAYGPSLISPLVPINAILENAREGSEKSWLKLIHGDYADELKQEKLRGRILKDLEGLVLKEAIRLRDLLKTAGVQTLPKSDPKLVTILPLPELGHKQYNGIVLEPHGEIAPASRYTRIQQLMDAEEISKIVGYVHSDVEWREIVALAFRNIIYDYMTKKIGKEIKGGQLTFGNNESSMSISTCSYLPRFRLDAEKFCRRSRIDPDRLQELHEELADAGEFDKRPTLGPLYNGSEIEKISQRYREFSGERSWRVSESSASAFIEQFPSKLRAEVASLLVHKKHITFLDRFQIVQHLKTAIDSMEKKVGSKKKFLVPLSPNSGYLVKIILEQDLKSQLTSSGWQICHSIQEALGVAKPNDFLVLCDDNVSSGTQAIAQFLSWLQIPLEQWPPQTQSEAGIDKGTLRDNDIELLKRINVGIAVCVQGEAAEARLNTELKSHGVKFIGITSGTMIATAKDRFDSLSSDTREWFFRVGEQVLKHVRKNEPRWKDDLAGLNRSCAADALGYGGLKGLTVTAWNVPTSTLPALWCPGLVDNEPWMPLFIRRGYLKHLVVA